MDQINTLTSNLISNIAKVIYDKEEQIKLILSSWLSGGHVLLEDVPGTGKTVLAKTIAKTVGLSYGRVQFTPDLLPNDIIGTSIYDHNKQKFIFRPGPIFSTFFLGDEINRATPRTQSALLECMAEKQITAENRTSKLDSLFFVMATQNPVEQHGTFPLPEAQLDRFSMKISMGYPSRAKELQIMDDSTLGDALESLETICQKESLLSLKELSKKVKVSPHVKEYIMDLVMATRNNRKIKMGASPRASITLLRASQAYSLLSGQSFVNATTVYKLAIPVMAHRLGITPEAKYQGLSQNIIVQEILDSVKAPTKDQS